MNPTLASLCRENVGPSQDDGGMDGGAVVRAFEAIGAAIAVLTVEVTELRPCSSSEPDPLNGLAHRCLDVLAAVSRSEAQIAALKAAAAAKYAETAASVAAPIAPAQDAVAREMAITAERSRAC